MRLVCASPSCAAHLTIGHIYSQQTALRRNGWRLEQQAGDDRPRAYCPRCKT